MKDLQDLLVRAVLQSDPHGWLQRQLARPECVLSPAERGWIEAISEDGLRLTRVLVRKLRIERLVAGDAAMAELYRSDPAAFAKQFTLYEARMPPHAVFPSEEAQQFAAQRKRR
ncbi:MAG TPA: hypothetical protein VFT55_16360 [Planctomycetota bacterium]|nr:hypothetical protein [Planctomycetota bacterium]